MDDGDDQTMEDNTRNVHTPASNGSSGFCGDFDSQEDVVEATMQIRPNGMSDRDWRVTRECWEMDRKLRSKQRDRSEELATLRTPP